MQTEALLVLSVLQLYALQTMAIVRYLRSIPAKPFGNHGMAPTESAQAYLQ